MMLRGVACSLLFFLRGAAFPPPLWVGLLSSPLLLGGAALPPPSLWVVLLLFPFPLGDVVFFSLPLEENKDKEKGQEKREKKEASKGCRCPRDSSTKLFFSEI